MHSFYFYNILQTILNICNALERNNVFSCRFGNSLAVLYFQTSDDIVHPHSLQLFTSNSPLKREVVVSKWNRMKLDEGYGIRKTAVQTKRRDFVIFVLENTPSNGLYEN